MWLCRQDDHPQNTKWCPSHRKITCRASKLERKRKISIVIPMVSESSRVHMSAIPLGEMRRCTFCGSRLRAWYLLVGDPNQNLHLPLLLGGGTTQVIYFTPGKPMYFRSFWSWGPISSPRGPTSLGRFRFYRHCGLTHRNFSTWPTLTLPLSGLTGLKQSSFEDRPGVMNFLSEKWKLRDDSFRYQFLFFSISLLV